MKQQLEWAHLNQKHDPNNPFSSLYVYEDGSMFYVEPVYYTQFCSFKEHHPDRINLILEEMERLVKMYRKVVFTGNFEHPLTETEDAVILEIFDITDKLQIFVEDKSRGSDYGD